LQEFILELEYISYSYTITVYSTESYRELQGCFKQYLCFSHCWNSKWLFISYDYLFYSRKL